MTGFPKPSPRIKPPKPLRRGPLKQKSPYATPEWASLRRQVRKRSRGICEECGLEPAVQVHHRSYAPGVGKRKLVVPLDLLADLCHPCHVSKHPHMRGG